jgi:ankyrin repeat protein
MCALFALKFSTSDIVADFEMKTNSDDCGDFDDVALKVTFEDGQSQIFLLQLKHSENMKNVTDKMFAAEKGAFSLQKYMRSISKFENTQNVSFILYTNNSTSIESKSTIYIKNEDKTNDKVVVTELQNLDSEKLLLENRKKNNLEPQNQKKGTNVFQFELNQSSGSVESLDDYLKRFYFFAHQTDVTGAQSLIKAMLKKEYGINDATCSSSLLQFMETWWSRNFILTKYDVIAKLAELTLTPFIQTISDSKCNEKSKFLNEAIMKFDMTFVRDTNDEVVANIWTETASDEEVSFTSLKYYGLRVKGIKDLPPKESSKVLWHLNKVPLIVKAEDCHQEQVKHAIRLLEKIKKKKVVLLANATKEEFPEWRIFQDLSDLPNEDVYKDIVEHFVVSLQDRPPIFLHQLLNFDQENARIVETTELIKMTQEVVQIGRRQENAFENYIPRSVSTISLDLNKMSEFCKKTGSLLIICNLSQHWNEAIRQLNLHVMELDQYLKLEKEEELSKVDVLLTSNKWAQVRFDEICKKTKKNVHLLQVFDDKICTSVLSKEENFSLEMMKSEKACVDEKEIFTYLDHPLNVICSPPGMGKSTLVSRLTSICPSSYWSVRVNLINHKAVFKNKCAHDEILHHFFEEEEDPLAVNIRSMLLQNKRMYLFLDGLDEIDSDCIPIALQFIQHISSLGHRVLITSRENLEQTVSHELNIFPIKIEELTEEQQKEYIQERLQNCYQKEEVEHIINKIYANVDIVNSRHLLGVPLQLFMITENFLNNKNLWTESDQEIFVLTKMYKIFFQGKKMHQHRKLRMHEYENQLGFDIDLYLEQYELLALKSCLDTTTFDKLKINLGRSQKFLEKLKIGDPFGIVSGVTEDNQAIFNHQTYAEYFACAWMKNNLDKVSLLQDDLFSKKNQNLRLIFDIMMAENSALHLAVIYRDSDLVSKHLDKSEVKDEGGRSPLQLLCTYGVEHPLLRKNRGLISEVIYIIKDIEEVSTQYREIFKMLSHCDVFQMDHVFQWTCLEFAIRLKNLFAVEKILERFGDSINLERLFECYDIGTLAIYSSQMGYPNLLGSAIKKESNVLSVKIGIQEITLLHVAVNGIKENNKFQHILMEERKKMITTLIECGLDVDQQCKDKRTPLHFAANDDVIAKLLLDLGANINATDNSGKTVLHAALESFDGIDYIYIKMLLDHGADINAADNYGKTVLHAAFRRLTRSSYDCIKMLLDHGADINAVDNSGNTVLHAAFESFDGNDYEYDCIKMLLDHGADINAVDNSGNTVLHAAFESFDGNDYEYDCIKMLLDHGADINAVDNSGNTVLHAAFRRLTRSSYDCIKMLLDHGADINAVDNSENTVLHAAFRRLRRSSYDCIKMLLDHGADINAVDNSGNTVLHAAFQSFDGNDYEYDCIKMLLDLGADINAVDKSRETVLHAAFRRLRRSSYDFIKMLLDHGADINAVDNSGNTVLHAAFQSFDGNDYEYDCIKMLLDLGADINAVDNSGKTVLHAAFRRLRRSSYDCIKMLLDYGADINAVDNSGNTVLHAAFQSFDGNDYEYDCIKMLLDLGADINAVDNSAKTVLHAAFESFDGNDYEYDCIKMLLDLGADINAVDNYGKTVLHAAFRRLRRSSYDCIKMLLDHGADINAVDNSGNTVLHAAFESFDGNDYEYDCIKMLLDLGADINAVDNSGKAVLHAAFRRLRRSSYDCIKMLLDHGADINAVDNSGNTVLHAAFESFDGNDYEYDCIKMLLDLGADINAVDNSGKTVLHAAFRRLRRSSYDCIKMLLDHGADINAVDNSGNTVLHADFRRLRRSSYDCIKMLLDHGADINAVDNSGNTVLHAAFRRLTRSSYDCIKMLLDHGADINAVDNSGNTVLHAAFESFDGNDYEYDCIKMLLDLGADINAVDNSGKTVLHAAFRRLRRSSYDCIKMLLDHGADINAVDNSGNTVLHADFRRLRRSSYDCIKMLLDHGADINAVDNSGNTVLHAAFRRLTRSSYDCIKMLLDHGADINAVDNSGNTVLHAAFESFDGNDYEYDCIKMLLDLGADINAVDNSGKTVLHAAFRRLRRSSYDCIKMLLDHGADINAVDNSGNTVLHAAFESFDGNDYEYDCIKMLLDLGADINAADNYGKTVLHAALESFDGEDYIYIKMLLDHGADINSADNSGKTVLHAAFKDPNCLPEVKVILLLLSRGVDANKRDKEQKTALDYAVTRRGSEPLLLSRYRQIVKIMFDAAAYGQLMSTDYVTFLHYAVYDGNCVAVELFLENGLDLDNIDVNNQKYPLHFAVENGHLRSDLLLKITKLMRDYKTHCKKCFPKNDNILGILEEYVSNGYESVSFF